MMRCCIYGFILLMVLGPACTREPHDYEHHRTSYFRNIHDSSYNDSILVCATFNIQLGFPATKNPWDKNISGADRVQVERIAAMVRQVDADIVALQEVPRNRYNAVIKDFIEKLATRLNMNYAFGAHGYNDPEGIYPVHGEWGNAILSKYRIEGIENTEVSYVDQWQKRSILCTLLEINGSFRLNAISYHYDNGLGEMNEAIGNTKLYLSRLSDPVIMMGDSNYQWAVDEYYLEFDEAGLADADSTYLTGIDRILFSRNAFQCLGAASWYDTINFTSDHPLNSCLLKIPCP